MAEGNLDEYHLWEPLYRIRCENPEYLRAKPYPLMAAYMENAAGPHYFATEEEHAEIRPSGILLIDALAHYYGEPRILPARSTWGRARRRKKSGRITP